MTCLSFAINPLYPLFLAAASHLTEITPENSNLLWIKASCANEPRQQECIEMMALKKYGMRRFIEMIGDEK